MWEPFGILPVNSTSQWKQASTERGTLNILLTCLITLILCVWTCLHLNIPRRDKVGWRHSVLRKLLWAFLGIFVPEVVSKQRANHLLFQGNIP